MSHAFDRRRALLVATLGATLVLAACGGSSNSETSATDWANSVCSAVTKWSSSTKSAVASLKGGNVSKDSVTSAAKDIEDATGTLADDLKGLGKPDTQSGQQAKDAVDALSTTVQNGADDIRSDVEGASGVSGIASAATSISGTVATMSSQVSTTVSQLQNLHPKGELENAFKSADSCSSLV